MHELAWQQPDGAPSTVARNEVEMVPSESVEKETSLKSWQESCASASSAHGLHKPSVPGGGE